MGSQLIWARERADMLGIKMRCIVSVLPRTFSQKLLSISSGKGSRAPKSPRRSAPWARRRSWPRCLLDLHEALWEEDGNARVARPWRRELADASGGATKEKEADAITNRRLPLIG